MAINEAINEAITGSSLIGSSGFWVVILASFLNRVALIYGQAYIKGVAPRVGISLPSPCSFCGILGSSEDGWKGKVWDCAGRRLISGLGWLAGRTNVWSDIDILFPDGARIL